MYNFKNDYSEGCHPAILEKLLLTNSSQQLGYGDDEYSNEARELIRKEIDNVTADIHFVSGGTQANAIIVSALLRPHESVIAAITAHIAVHEAGAIESTGHKINIIETKDGKITKESIAAILDHHSNVPHMVKPKLVYISNSTEIGTIYKKAELEKLSAFCKSNDLYLFMDGARIGAALSANDNDLSFSDVAKLVDVFYIGGTKNGALIGEAIVLINDHLKNEFGFYLKQKGALLAKGRLLGIQFLELFRNGLYLQLAAHANKMAMKIANAVKETGGSFLTAPVTNQVFPILPYTAIRILEERYIFYVWKKIDEEYAAIRIITSWATNEEQVDTFIQDLLNAIAKK